MVAFVYLVTHKATGRSYVGMTTRRPGRRWKEHKNAALNGSNLKFHRALNKYGDAAFSWQVLWDGPEEFVNSVEKALIALGFGQFNLTAGGQGVLRPSPETRACIGRAHKGRIVSLETRERQSRAQLNRPPIKDETRTKLSLTSTGRTHSPETRLLQSQIALNRTDEDNRNRGAKRRGRKHTEESKQKMSVAHTGKKQSAATVEKRIAPLIGRKRPPEVGAKISATKRAKAAA